VRRSGAEPDLELGEDEEQERDERVEPCGVAAKPGHASKLDALAAAVIGRTADPRAAEDQPFG
jgi:hypothetical protein